MDFFCQRCGKSLEIDESLLRVDLPMGDLARGDIDLDKVFAQSRNSTAFSHNSMVLKNSGNNRFSVYSASVSASSSVLNSTSSTYDKSMPKLSASSSFILPRKQPQAESPIPKNLSSHFNNNRPSKTSTILLKADKPTLSTSNLSSSSTPSSSSSSSTTPPSPSSSNTSTTNAPPTTPKAASPPYPHFPHHAPPQSTPPGQSTLPSPSVLTIPQNPFPMQKAKSEFFRATDMANTSNSSSTSASNLSTSAKFSNPPGLSQSQSMSKGLGMSQSFMTPYGSSMGSLRYIREGSRMSRPQLDMPQLSSTPSLSTMSLADAQAASKLFQTASEQIGMDLPMCFECTKTLTLDLDDELSMTDAQNSAYIYYLEALENKEKGWTPLSEIEEEMMNLEEEERKLRKEISSLHEQKRQAKDEVEKLKNEATKLVNFEERYWLNFDELHAALSNFVDERDACKVQTATTKELLKNSQRTQIINDAFHIWHDGHFGTVNSFRLGRLPSQPVDWNEINAAWGLATLLLYNMARRIDFKFSSYRLVPSGSCSKMEKLDNSNTYELFGSSDISLGRLFWYRRFDNGMVAFLNCLKEMGDYAEAKDKSFRLPHRMEKDKVGDMSIKIQFNNEETWTKSLKYTLTNLKWLLAWVVRMEAEQMAANHGKILSSSSLSTTISPSSDSLDNANNNNNNTVNNNYSINNNNNASNNQGAAPRSRLTMLFSRAGNS